MLILFLSIGFIVTLLGTLFFFDNFTYMTTYFSGELCIENHSLIHISRSLSPIARYIFSVVHMHFFRFITSECFYNPSNILPSTLSEIIYQRRRDCFNTLSFPTYRKCDNYEKENFSPIPIPTNSL